MCRLFADACKLFADKCRPMQINEDDCKTRSTESPNVTTRPEPKGSLRPFIKWLGMSSQPLGRAPKRGTPETCPKSSHMRHPFDKGKLPNMSPKQAMVHGKTCNLMRVICRLMPISADYLQISADQCRLINEADCKTTSTKSPNVTTRPEPKGSLRPFFKWLGMSSQPLGRASKAGTPEMCPKSSGMRLRFDKGKRSNMFPKQAVVHCKTCNLMRVICRLFADKCKFLADKCS